MQVTVLISRHAGSADYSTMETTIAERGACTGLPVLLLPDLYHLAEDSPLWARLAALPGPVLCAGWLHPRPLEWLLRRHGVGADGLQVVSLHGLTVEAIDALFAPYAGSGGAVETIDEDTASRWYPVVDRSRCTDCHHCLQFCLFGVYALDANGQMTIQAPDACKAGCPACSRICPHGAIIFPLYAKDPAIAGAPGLYMVPDAAARKMFYTRTKLPCPRCGMTEAGNGGDLCPECSRPIGAAPAAHADELDDLIDSLDALTRRER